MRGRRAGGRLAMTVDRAGGEYRLWAEGLAFEGANSPGVGPDMAERLARR